MIAMVDLPTVEFADQAAWEQWLEQNHASSNGVWLKIARKGAAAHSVTKPQALDSAICFGWIDGQADKHDDAFWLQRFTPRRPRSKWSQVNRAKAQELIAQGRMRAAGLNEVEAAQEDGRWDAAYEPQSQATVPPDFQKALDEHPDAKRFFETLTGNNRYAFLYRLHNVKTPERRAKRITDYVAMLSERRTFYP